MLGHGSPDGLLFVDQFSDAGIHIIDELFVEVLKIRKNNIYIWCNPDQFVQIYGQSGLFSGMFIGEIGEIGEAYCFGFDDIDWDLIDQSINGFAYIFSK